MRLSYFPDQFVLRERRFHSRYEILAVCLVIGMLELTSAAFRKVTAWRHLMMWTSLDGPVLKQSIAGHSERNVPAARGDPVTTGGDANDFVSHSEDRTHGESR